MSFNNQLQINPKKYLDELGKICSDLGVKIYENTPIKSLEHGDVCQLQTKDNKFIKSKNVIIASQFPWYDGNNLYFAKEKGDRSYLIGAHYKEEFQRGIYISCDEPKKTFRILEEDNKRLLILGGNAHKVGQGHNESKIYEHIEEFAKHYFHINQIDYKWSAQDYISYDHLPFVGHVSKKQTNIYIATGFSKWGLTNGCASAIIMSDMIVNDSSKYEELFKPYRKNTFFKMDFIKENLNVSKEYIKGKLKLGQDEIPNKKGEGKIVNIEGKRYGAYRHFDNNIYIVDITCTHLGCELTFNSAEKTWDCPCHASRFDYKGNILNGPALRPLDRQTQYEKFF